MCVCLLSRRKGITYCYSLQWSINERFMYLHLLLLFNILERFLLRNSECRELLLIQNGVCQTSSRLIAWAGVHLSSCIDLSLQFQLNQIIYKFKSKYKPALNMLSTAQASAVPMDLKEVLSLLPSATVSRVNVEKMANRDLNITDWNSLPPAPLAGWDPQEHGLSLADLNEYSISKSTGPDDSFFHLSGHSHKYSNL